MHDQKLKKKKKGEKERKEKKKTPLLAPGNKLQPIAHTGEKGFPPARPLAPQLPPRSCQCLPLCPHGGLFDLTLTKEENVRKGGKCPGGSRSSPSAFPHMLVGRKRRRESSVKESTGMGTLQRLRRKHPMEKSRRTISCLWRTGSRSSPLPPTPPWEAPLPAATRWSWWRSTGRSSETHCIVKITSPRARLLCVTRTPQAPRSH